MKKNSGQILVFVLLVMLLGLTIGLSVTSRTLQDLKQTSVTDQSSRAFTAAEAGIEQQLNQLGGGSVTKPSIPGINNINVVQTPQNTGYESGAPIMQDDVVTINLFSDPNYYSGNLTIYWEKTSDPHKASLELSFYGDDSHGDNYFVKKYAYNPPDCNTGSEALADCNSNISSSFNNFNGGSVSNNPSYNAMTPPITVPTNSKFLRIRPVYNDTSIAVSPSTTQFFPVQGYKVTSTATTNGDVSRSVEVNKSNPGLPPMFDYVLYSSNNVVQ